MGEEETKGEEGKERRDLKRIGSETEIWRYINRKNRKRKWVENRIGKEKSFYEVIGRGRSRGCNRDSRNERRGKDRGNNKGRGDQEGD